MINFLKEISKIFYYQLISFTKISLKKGIVLRIVPKINIFLTLLKIVCMHSIFCIFTKNKGIMQFTPSKLNTFMFFKLPSAFWSGVRVKTIESSKCEVTVKHRWFNQNPFNSMYFAVQAMAAEFTTGALVMFQIKKSKANISMLVAQNKAVFTKKATGRITFTCNEGDKIAETIQKAIETKEGQTVWITSRGVNENGEQVSEMQFEWTVRVRG